MQVFISYAHEDEALRDELAKHLTVLRQQGFISDWHDRLIRAGQSWQSEIESNLRKADAVILLISPDFLNSHFCLKVELPLAVELSTSGSKIPLFPVILRPCDWEHTAIGKFQALPQDGRPVVMWESRDAAFAQVVKELRKVLAPPRGPDVTLHVERSAPTVTSELIAKARSGRTEDVDFLMSHVPPPQSLLQQTLFDQALSLIRTTEGIQRLQHYHRTGTESQRLAAAIFLKCRFGCKALDRRPMYGQLLTAEAFSSRSEQ